MHQLVSSVKTYLQYGDQIAQLQKGFRVTQQSHLQMSLCSCDSPDVFSGKKADENLYYNTGIYKVALQYEKPDDIVIPEVIETFDHSIDT